MRRTISLALILSAPIFAGCEGPSAPSTQLPVANADNCRLEHSKSAPWTVQMKRDHGSACARGGAFQYGPSKTY
jgi:entry exclusion lipoprotein TrbK